MKTVVIVVCLAAFFAVLGFFWATRNPSGLVRSTGRPEHSVSVQAQQIVSNKNEYLERIENGDVEAGLILINAIDRAGGSETGAQMEKIARKLTKTNDARIQYILGRLMLNSLRISSNPRGLSGKDKDRLAEAMGYLASAASQRHNGAKDLIETMKPVLKTEKNN